MKYTRVPMTDPSADALAAAAATITAALIQRAAPGPIDRAWITSAFAEAYVAVLMAPPQIEAEFQQQTRPA